MKNQIWFGQQLFFVSKLNISDSNLVTIFYAVLYLPCYSQRFLSFNRNFSSSHQLQCHGDHGSTIYSELSEEIKHFEVLFFWMERHELFRTEGLV